MQSPSQSSIISLHIGQAGIQSGASCWLLFSLQHTLNPQQTLILNEENTQAYFSENNGDNLQSRAVFIDLEPTAIDQLKTGLSRSLHRHQNMISGKEDTAGNYARGYYTVGRKLLQPIMDKIRRQAERCSNLQGFLIYRSVGGGTGSGLGSLIAENLSASYDKKTKIGMNIFPYSPASPSCLQPYNSLLSTATGLDQLDVSMVFDNEAIHNICHRNLGIQQPLHTNLNRVISQVVSAITVGTRYISNYSLNDTLSQFYKNFVPYPRAHSLLLSYSPFNEAAQGYCSDSLAPMTAQALQPANMMAKCDPLLGKYLAMALLYRGEIASKDISATVATIKTRKTINFVDWSPLGFKIGLQRSRPITPPGSDMAAMPKQCCIIANSTAISHFYGRMTHKCDLMASKDAFLHFYTNEGMEKEEFNAARENMAALQADYEEMEEETVYQQGD